MTPPKIDKPLSNLRLAFCREYAIDHNGKQAAIRAGYSHKGAEVRGSELLTKCKVKEEIARIETETAERTGYTIEQYQADIDKAVKFAYDNRQPSAVISGITIKGRSMGYDKSNDINSIKPPTPLTEEEAELCRKSSKSLTLLRLSKGA